MGIPGIFAAHSLPFRYESAIYSFLEPIPIVPGGQSSAASLYKSHCRDTFTAHVLAGLPAPHPADSWPFM
jgi:hypothetical protein